MSCSGSLHDETSSMFSSSCMNVGPHDHAVSSGYCMFSSAFALDVLDFGYSYKLMTPHYFILPFSNDERCWTHSYKPAQYPNDPDSHAQIIWLNFYSHSYLVLLWVSVQFGLSPDPLGKSQVDSFSWHGSQAEPVIDWPLPQFLCYLYPCSSC